MNPTKEDLEKISRLKNEVKRIEIRIKRLQNQKKEIIRDQVKGSSPNYPYCIRGINIEGIDYSPRKDRLIELWMIRKKNTEEEIINLESLINNIKDPDVRGILTAKYSEDKTWEEVAEIMKMSRITAIRKHNKFLKVDTP